MLSFLSAPLFPLYHLIHSLPSFFLSFPLSSSLFLFSFPFFLFLPFFLSFVLSFFHPLFLFFIFSFPFILSFFHPFFSSFFLSFSFFLSLPFLLSPCLSPLFPLASFLSSIHSLCHYLNIKFNALCNFQLEILLW